MQEFRWSLGIGDPTILGWLICASYFLVAIVCLKASRFSAARTYPPGRLGERTARGEGSDAPERRRLAVNRSKFWGSLSGFTCLLAVNKQLDLQTLLTDLARVVATTYGWYEDRRTVQLGFVFLLFVGVLGAVGALIQLIRGQVRTVALPLMGGVMLLVFVLLRASAFHQLSRWIGEEPGLGYIDPLLELLGALLIGVSAGFVGTSGSRQRS